MILIAFGVGMIVAYGSVAALIMLLALKPANKGYQPLPATRMPPPPMPKVKPAREEVAIVGGVNYSFIGLTGLEDE